MPKDEAVEVLSRVRSELAGPLGEALRQHLTRREVARTVARVDQLLASRCHPFPSKDWPAIPWPPF